MSLPRTKIELGTASWNPVKGCTNDCPWCWAWSQAQRRLSKCDLCNKFVPHLHPKRLGQVIDAPAERLLVCWTSDLFCSGVEPNWINDVFFFASGSPQHKYLFLTKCPQSIPERGFPDNWWFGTSISGVNEEDLYDKYSEAEKFDRAYILAFRSILNKFLMIEPLRGEEILFNLFKFYKWIVVGAQTGRGPIETPDPEFVKMIIKEAQAAGVPVFLKNNLLKRLPELPKIQEIPKELEVRK